VASGGSSVGVDDEQLSPTASVTIWQVSSQHSVPQ
jgi:hypothetical protein